MLELTPRTSVPPRWDPPTTTELRGRLVRLQGQMREQGLDWYVAYSPPNVTWLTDFTHDVDERPFLLLVPAEGDPTMVAPRLERDHVLARTRLPLEVADYRDIPAPPGQTWQDALRAVVAVGSRVGVEPVLPVDHAAALPGTWTSVDLIDRLRWVKSDYEIGRLTYAAEVLNEAHATGLDLVRPGATNAQVSAAACAAMSQRMGADNPAANVLALSAFFMVWPTRLSADPHNVPDLHEPFVTGGPQVTIALVNANGYAAELERTFFLGSVPAAARDPFDAMSEARATAFDLLRPGVTLAEVDVAVRRVLHRRGYGEALLHRTGHGMGLLGHEAPFLAEADETVAEPGMVFSIEPGIYLPGIGGFRHSDTVLVTADGCTSLTRAPETLAELCL